MYVFAMGECWSRLPGKDGRPLSIGREENKSVILKGSSHPRAALVPRSSEGCDTNKTPMAHALSVCPLSYSSFFQAHEWEEAAALWTPLQGDRAIMSWSKVARSTPWVLVSVSPPRLPELG